MKRFVWWIDDLMDRATDSFLTFMIAALVVSSIILGVVAVPFLALSARQCGIVAEETGLATRFRIVGGCFVEHEGAFVPYDRWITIVVPRAEIGTALRCELVDESVVCWENGVRVDS